MIGIRLLWGNEAIVFWIIIDENRSRFVINMGVTSFDKLTPFCQMLFYLFMHILSTYLIGVPSAEGLLDRKTYSHSRTAAHEASIFAVYDNINSSLMRK